MKTRNSDDVLGRQAYYGLAREHLEDLIVLSKLSSERKALGAVFYILVFVQGSGRFPRKDELAEIVSDCLDRNLGKEDFFAKWHLNPSRDPDVEDPEKYYLETIQKLELLSRIRDGWEGWMDGDLSKQEKKLLEAEKVSRLKKGKSPTGGSTHAQSRT
jgi:hypothetical protein